MWALLSSRLRLWLLLALVAPVIGWLLGVIGDRLAARNGPTTVSRGLRKASDFLQRRSRGPLARRDAGNEVR